MTDSEKLVQLIESLRRRHQIPPDMMRNLHDLVGLIRYSEIVQQ
jgi:hypothetical protein